MTRLFDALEACEDAPLADDDRPCRECGEGRTAFVTLHRWVDPDDDYCGRCRHFLGIDAEDPTL